MSENLTRRRRYTTPARSIVLDRVDLVRHTQKREPSRGVLHRCRLVTCCSFDPDTHAEIRARAIRERTSFAEQVRLLVEWGLETDS